MKSAPDVGDRLSPACGLCGFHKTCKSPKLTVNGNGDRRILVVGSVAGQTDDLEGRFVFEPGLRLLLAKLGLSEDDCWFTKAVICHNGSSSSFKKKVEASSAAVDHCRPSLIRTIRELKPVGILLVGPIAISSAITWMWGKAAGETDRWVGYLIPWKEMNCWVAPTYAFYDDNPFLQAKTRAHVKQLVRSVKKGRPYEEGYKWKPNIHHITAAEAVPILKAIVRRQLVTAFDYETTMLKPEGPGSHILSAAVCVNGSDGLWTGAFPFDMSDEKFLSAWRKYLRARIDKIAANMKFEIRWSVAKLGVMPRQIVFDTMLGAHTLDHRTGVSGVKFQAFARLGVGAYSDVVDEYLKSDDPSKPNQAIQQIAMPDLLQYNGMDALVEYLLYESQLKELET
jgi:uracil-DNA glycosylase family 4